MDAKELRLGNCCKEITHSKNGVVKVSKRHFEDIEDNEIDLFPIPLTEEWLLKFGFYWDKKKVYLCLNTVAFRIRYRGHELTLFQNGNSITIPYVFKAHQLQNLYFSLTNTELSE